MPLSEATIRRLSSIPDARKSHNVSLSAYTRFAIGGPATLFFDTSSEAAFVEALQVTANCSDSHLVIGGGSNLIVSDAGFDGVVLRYKEPKFIGREPRSRHRLAQRFKPLSIPVSRTVYVGCSR